MKTSEIITLVAQLIGALTGISALIISLFALHFSYKVSSLKDRPIIYLTPSKRAFSGPVQLGNISDDDLFSKGVPLHNIVRYRQNLDIKNGTQIIAQNLSVTIMYRYGSKEREFETKVLDFYPPDQKGFVDCDFDEDVVETMKKKIPVLIHCKVKYKDIHEQAFENDQYFRFDFLILEDTFRGIQTLAIAKKYWDQTAGNTLNIGPSPTITKLK